MIIGNIQKQGTARMVRMVRAVDAAGGPKICRLVAKRPLFATGGPAFGPPEAL